MGSEGVPSVNNIPAIVIHAPLLGTGRYATGVVLTNATPQHVAIVDGSGDQITSFGGGTQYATNVAYADGNTGTLAVTIRDDALTTLTEADGDFSGLRVDSTGRLWANVSNTVTVQATNLDIRDLVNTDVVTAELSATDNAVLDAIAASVSAIDTDATTIIGHLDGVETLLGTMDADTSGIITAVQLIDDIIYTAGTDTYTEATSKGGLILAVRRDADTSLANTTNEFVPLQVDANGYLKVEVFSGATLPVSLTSTTVTGTVAVTQSGTWDEVGINDSGNSITVDQPTGTNLHVVTDSGTITTVSTVTAVTTLTGGGIAHDSADSGNPHKIGYKAFSPDGTTPGTAVAENDRTDAKADLDGRQFVNDEHPRYFNYHLNTSTAQTDTSVVADPGDGFQIVITDMQFSNGAATAINFFLEEGASTIWGPVYLEAINGRGYVWKGKKHVTASTALTLTTSSSTAHSVEILGYIQAV